LWEHVDYEDLTRVPRTRLHIPITTNPDAIIVADGRRYHLPVGHIYVMRPTSAHGACNLGSSPRVHVIIDVYDDEVLRRHMSETRTCSSRALPPLADDVLQERLADLKPVMGGGEPNVRERAVLLLYFRYQVDEGYLYTELEKAYGLIGDAERASFWAARRRLVLGTGVAG
jgi:hypothetical protein